MAVLWDGQSGCGVSDQAFVFETYSKNCLYTFKSLKVLYVGF